MTHPSIHVTVDGIPVSGAFFARLVRLSITDREGIQSDILELTFNDAPPHFLAPRRGARMVVILDGTPMGSYVMDWVEFKCLPYTITLRGHSADLRSQMKAHRTKHWDGASVKNILAQKASEYGLRAKISDAVSGHVYDWIGQQDESDLHFLERLAQRHGALFTIKHGTLLWLERGTGKTADGTAIAPSVIAMPAIIEGTCRVTETDLGRFARVKAYWQDRKGAKRREVIVEADPEASGAHVLRDPFCSQAEAEAAAKAAARQMRRGLIETSCSVVGRPDLMAGQPIIYTGIRPDVDGREFLLDMVKHSFTKSGGLRTAFTGKLKAAH